MCTECGHSSLKVQTPFTVPKELPLGHPAQMYAYPWKDRQRSEQVLEAAQGCLDTGKEWFKREGTDMSF